MKKTMTISLTVTSDKSFEELVESIRTVAKNDQFYINSTKLIATNDHNMAENKYIDPYDLKVLE